MTCDAEIKLFGKILPVVFLGADDSVTGADESYSGFDTDLCLEDNNTTSAENDEANEGIESSDYEKQEAWKDDKTEELSEQKLEEDQDQIMDESENPLTSSDLENGSITPTGEDLQTVKLSETENEPNNVTDSQQKQLKKPDKILPCPRCSSTDTKFCYYNNNNVNQPRHFCRSCQRYWTAGGTMRNIPVGAGRRKNKSFASHYRHINIPEGLLAAGVESPNGYHNPVFKPNCTVLSFGPDLGQREFTAPALNQAEKSLPNVIQHVFHKSEHKSSSCKGVDNGDEGYRAPSVMTSKAVVEDGKNKQHKEAMNNTNGFPSPVPFFHGVPWPIPWNAAVPFGPFGFPIPFCPAPYWNCSVPPWSVPWLSPPSQAANEKALGPDPNSHLGKHSREGDLLKRKNPDGNETSEQKSSERSILIPKTLRIDDPDEAAKSSIWSTLGIKYDSASRGGFFKALQPKSVDKDNKTNASPVLHANPAALSRLVSLQERA